MGDRRIFLCPECGDEIYTGGGVNEPDEFGIIKCPGCKANYRIVTTLTKVAVKLDWIDDAQKDETL